MNRKVIQINVKPDTPGEHGIPKVSVENGILAKDGFKGDYNNFRTEKRENNPDMAVLLFPVETIQELNDEGWPICPGDLGENLTITGISHSHFSPGQRFQIGEAIIEISFECDPCKNLSTLPYVGDEKINLFIKTLINRRGWFAKVIQSGMVNPGDSIRQIK